MRKKLLQLLAVIWLCACCVSAPLTYPFGSQRLAPEGWYQVLYQRVRVCAIDEGHFSGLEYKDIDWFITKPGAMSNLEDSVYIAGLASNPNRIYLDPAYSMNMEVVQHEISHLVLDMSNNAHEDALFIKCSKQ